MITKLNMSRFAFLLVGIVAIAMFSPDVMAAKTKICHKSGSNGKQKTISVSEKAMKGHEGHGDYIGKCGEVLNSERLMVKCELLTEATTYTVVAASGSTGVQIGEVEALPLVDDDCAQMQVDVAAAQCQEIGVIGTPDSQVYSFSCPDESVAIEPPA